MWFPSRVSKTCEVFLQSKEKQELTPRTKWEYKYVCETIIRTFGHSRRVTEADLWRLREALATPKSGHDHISPISLKRWLTHARTVLKKHHSVEVCDALKSPPIREIRRHRHNKRRHFTREECLALLEHPHPAFRSMVWLGLNCAFGPADCRELKLEDISDGWLRSIRPKTGMPRICPLWQETLEALTFPMWDRFRVNKQLRIFLPGVGVGFYGLRRTWCTVASASGCPDWVLATIMGHADSNIRSQHYREQVHARSLTQATDFVYAWLKGEIEL
jgi:integrase